VAIKIVQGKILSVTKEALCSLLIAEVSKTQLQETNKENDCTCALWQQKMEAQVLYLVHYWQSWYLVRYFQSSQLSWGKKKWQTHELAPNGPRLLGRHKQQTKGSRGQFPLQLQMWNYKKAGVKMYRQLQCSVLQFRLARSCNRIFQIFWLHAICSYATKHGGRNPLKGREVGNAIASPCFFFLSSYC
jgi:hypothetical protein